jgi:hypothetical protein
MELIQRAGKSYLYGPPLGRRSPNREVRKFMKYLSMVLAVHCVARDTPLDKRWNKSVPRSIATRDLSALSHAAILLACVLR